jgi:mRNA deadenylase 3'-5' endonuclease subunit Ccr4
VSDLSRSTLNLPPKDMEPTANETPDILVASTHILFNPGRGDVKLGQVRHILNRCAALGTGPLGSCHLVMLGDFNSAPHSGVYDFILNGSLDIRETDRRRLGGQIEGYSCERFTSDLRYGGVQKLRFSSHFEQDASDGRDLRKLGRQGWNQESLTVLGCEPSTIQKKNISEKDLDALFTIRHPYGPSRLKSSHREVTGSEPLFTTAHQAYMGTVDFIFYDSAPCLNKSGTSTKLIPTAVLSCPDPLRFQMGIPNASYASDHIALTVDFCYA